jgi:TPR repeat protein
MSKNIATAMSWYRKAAEQGNGPAQYYLGLMYAQGRGVPQDFVQAHMWLNLAATQDTGDAAQSRDTLAAMMTPAQVAEAQKLAREWKPKLER